MVGELNDIVEQLEASLASLRGEPRELDGGITNRNFHVTLGEAEYVVRRPGKDTDLLGIAPDGQRTAAPPSRRLRCIVLEDPRSVVLGNEPVQIGGEVLGRVTSGGYGYTVERSIAYAYMPSEVELGGAVEIDVFGEWVAGEVTREPLFDPKGERVRG
jgi:glycine cleavage system aminomethyltransferase T